MDLADRAGTDDREVRVADSAPCRHSESAAAVRRHPERKAQVVAMTGQVLVP